MNAAEVRARLFNKKLKIKAVPDAVIDGWDELTDLKGQLSVLELTGADTSDANKLAKGEDGEVDAILATAVMICKSLVLTESKERIFTDRDGEAVAGMGSTVIKPLQDLIVEVSGMAPQVKEEAKTFLKPMTANTSSASSASTSTLADVPVTESGVSA